MVNKLKIEVLETKAEEEIRLCQKKDELEDLRIKYLGRKGLLTSLLKELPLLPPLQKKELGFLLNQSKKEIENLLKDQEKKIIKEDRGEWFDLSLPGKIPPRGHLHPTTTAIWEISQLFYHLGFTLVSYPEVEWEYFAFEALNMPKNHPARDDFETFFVDTPAHQKFGKMVLTPHTSSGQVREMKRVGQPPVRMINVGKCYRPNWDATHLPMFHQFEGLVIDKGINLSHLKGIFDYFVKHFYGPKREIRLRPFHFQFTEPSFEVDISCAVCGGKGCRLCKQGWLELGGSGMVHPKVLEAGGINPRIYSGFAFGWGIERTFMMKSDLKLDDIRLFYQNDGRFLEQF